MVVAVGRRHPKTVPRRRAVEADLPVARRRFQKLERTPDSRSELIAAECAELRLGVVHLIDVDRFETEARPALSRHLPQIARRHAMRSLVHAAPTDETRPHILFSDP